MSKIQEHLCFSSRHEWRAWLQENHAKAKEAWLIFYKKGDRQTDAVGW